MFQDKHVFFLKPHLIFGSFLLVFFILSCADINTKTNDTDTVTQETDSKIMATTNNQNGDDYYYGSRSHSLLEQDMYNYQFVHFKVEEDNIVKGVFYSIPYGTDGSKGSFKGVIDMNTKVLHVERSYLAEGERYQQSESYAIMGNTLDLGYLNPDGSRATLNRLSPEEYNTLFKTYEDQELHASLNLSDPTHLLNLTSLLSEMNYNSSDVQNLKFMERMVELDNDHSTQEYLLYVMDPMLCGSGGCNLYILNHRGKEIGRLSVTKPPIYLERFSIEEGLNNKGEWKTLYVYSDGMRRIEATNGFYPSNPSMEKEFQEEELKSFPEDYQLVMDYLE